MGVRLETFDRSRHDHTVYLVLNDFGRRGRSWRETDAEQTLATVITDLISNDSVAVVVFNINERWANDVSEDIARQIPRQAHLTWSELSPSVVDFIDRHAGEEQQQTLRLVK